MQRDALEGTHEVIERSVEFQQDVNARMLDAVEPARDVSERGTDLVRTGVETYFDAIEAAVPGDQEVVADIRETIDEQLETLEETQTDALDELEADLEDGADSVDELLEEFLETLDEQLDSLLEAHEDLEEQTAEAVGDLEAAVEDLQDDSKSRARSPRSASRSRPRRSPSRSGTSPTATRTPPRNHRIPRSLLSRRRTRQRRRRLTPPNTFVAAAFLAASLPSRMATDDPTTVERDADAAAEAITEATTTVDVRCTGHVRTAIGEHEMEFTFEGGTLRAFLDAFFETYDVEDLVIAETEADATAHGWAPTDGDPPGTWKKNPVGEQTRAFARIAINGTFNEHLDGLDTELETGDRVALVYPFMFCC